MLFTVDPVGLIRSKFELLVKILCLVGSRASTCAGKVLVPIPIATRIDAFVEVGKIDIPGDTDG